MLSRYILIGCFALLALFPAVQTLTHVFPDRELQENRTPAPRPKWAGLSVQEYFLGWQSWFNDRYAGRAFLIRLKTQLDYSLFSYSDKVYIGKDGWLFYRSVVDVEEPSMEALTDGNFDAIVKNFTELNARLNNRGIRLLILDIELKDSFYPENLPRAVVRRPVSSRYKILHNRLARETGAVVFDSSALLSGIKPERTLFHRTDFHWNDPAAFVVAREVVNRIARLAGPSYPGWRWPLEIDRRPLSGGEASFMPLLRPLSEEALFVHKTWPDLPQDYRSPDGPFEFSIIHKGHDPSLLPGIVVFGDSFFDGFLRSGFAEHFQSLHRARIYHSTLSETVAAIPPSTRFFMVQFIVPSVPSYLTPLAPEVSPEGGRH